MKSKFFVYALASMAFAACSDDNEVTDNGGAVVNPTGEAYVSLSINTPAGTRALNTPDQENATSDESTVKTLKVIFFDSSNNVVASGVKDWTVGTDAEAGNPNQPTGTPGKAFKVDAAAIKVLVVANPIAAFNPSDGQNYATVNAALTATAAEVSTVTNFMMSNASGELAPHAANLTSHSTKEAAEAAPLEINIDRVVAKVRVYTAKRTSTFAAISDEGWVLNVTNKKFYPCSERVMTAVGTLTPFDQYGLGSYRKDPNYDTQSDPTVAAYAENYDSYTSTSTPTWINPCDATLAGKPQYCLENTQEATYNLHAYTTQVLFKAVVSPTNLTDVDGGTYDITPGDDWIAINSQYYSYDKLVKYIEKELTNKYSSSDPSLYTNPLFDQLRGYVTDVLGASATVPEIDKSVTTALNGTTTPTLDDKVKEYIIALTADGMAVAAAANRAKKVGNLSYYAGGVNYYKIMIEHDNDNGGAQNNALGEFGVVRNSVYDVNIKAVKHPGYPIIPDPDPAVPDEDNNAWLSVQININPWTWYSQEVEL